MKKRDLEKQAQEILRLAEKSGVQSNYFFATTFDRYMVQLQILEQLKKTIDEEGMLVEKEYIKGKANLYTNPAVSDFNKTTDSANKTVATLMRIIKAFGDSANNDIDPLMDMINGHD